MKKITFLKGTLALTILVPSVLLLSSFSNKHHPKNTNDVSDLRSNSKFADDDQDKDAKFLVSAAEINLEEIQLGKLARQNGSSAEVKELGKMMEDAHTKSLKDLTALAKRKDITIPTASSEKANDAYNKLKEKSGKDFDKAYTNMMVEGHKDAIKLFEKASNDANDNDIKNWAAETLPELRKHLEHSTDCQKKCDKNDSDKKDTDKKSSDKKNSDK